MDVFSVKPKKQPKVSRRLLGKNKAHALYYRESNLIEIDSRVKGRKEMILYFHEYFHHIFPELSEEEIIVKSEYTADFFWKNDFRKVDNKK